MAIIEIIVFNYTGSPQSKTSQKVLGCYFYDSHCIRKPIDYTNVFSHTYTIITFLSRNQVTVAERRHIGLIDRRLFGAETYIRRALVGPCRLWFGVVASSRLSHASLFVRHSFTRQIAYNPIIIARRVARQQLSWLTAGAVWCLILTARYTGLQTTFIAADDPSTHCR